MNDSLIDLGINGSLVLIAIGLALALVFFIVHSVMNIKESWKALAGIVGVVVFLFIMYTMASGDKTGALMAGKYADISPETMKMVSAGVNGSLGLMAFALASWVVLEIVNLFK